MHNIYDCVDSFSSLLDTEYHMVLGRKGVSVSLHITFDKKDCFHLMGLQYLTDRPQLNRDRGRIFNEIKERKITTEQVETSNFYYKISCRIDKLPDLEKYFCRSFFPEERKDYTKNQASWTLLYKEKRKISTEEVEVLYDRKAEIFDKM